MGNPKFIAVLLSLVVVNLSHAQTLSRDEMFRYIDSVSASRQISECDVKMNECGNRLHKASVGFAIGGVCLTGVGVTSMIIQRKKNTNDKGLNMASGVITGIGLTSITISVPIGVSANVFRKNTIQKNVEKDNLHRTCIILYQENGYAVKKYITYDGRIDYTIKTDSYDYEIYGSISHLINKLSEMELPYSIRQDMTNSLKKERK